MGNLPPNAWSGYSSSLNKGTLSDNDFVYDGVTYVVTNLTDRGDGDVLLELNKPIPASLKAALTLRIRGREFALADATAPNAFILRWENTGFRFSLDDTPTVKLITPATTAPPPPPVDLSGTRTVWSATLTAATFSLLIGFDTDNGMLSDRTFTYDGVSYSIDELYFRPFDKSLNVGIDGGGQTALKRPELTLNVGNSLSDIRQFALEDAMTAGTVLFWANSGLNWSAGDTVRLWLTVDVGALNLPTLTASFSPSPDGPVNEDWETNSAHDLWSSTLTARDLTTPESAPANVGCDDTQAGVECSSALTDTDFTFKRVTYTVKAISYNQRKVTQDPNNPFNIITYEEKLKLTLDKSIPESLQSCLTLHAGDTKFGFGEVRQYATLSRSTTNDVANDTVTWSDIGAQGWGLNWSAGDMVELRLPNVGCLTLTLSEPVTAETSLQWRRGGTADESSDYQRISLPTFAAGNTTASTPIRPVDDSDAEGCETIILAMTMWAGEYWAVHENFDFAIQDDDGGARCVGGG